MSAEMMNLRALLEKNTDPLRKRIDFAAERLMKCGERAIRVGYDERACRGCGVVARAPGLGDERRYGGTAHSKAQAGPTFRASWCGSG